jgi:hypothetical protein
LTYAQPQVIFFFFFFLSKRRNERRTEARETKLFIEEALSRPSDNEQSGEISMELDVGGEHEDILSLRDSPDPELPSPPRSPISILEEQPSASFSSPSPEGDGTPAFPDSTDDYIPLHVFLDQQHDIVIQQSETRKPTSFREFLQNWAVRGNVARVRVNELLKGIKEFVELPHNIDLNIPDDYRSLLKTPRGTVQISPAGTFGHFASLGLKAGINRVFRDGYRPKKDNKLQLRTFVDAFNPHKGRLTSKFWAVLHSILDDVDQRVFMSGLYIGSHNPEPFNDILEDFVSEFIELMKGFTIESYHAPLKLEAGGPFIMDILAKADVKCTKQSGYCSCEMCIEEGVFIGGQVRFVSLTFTLRTDQSFRAREQPRHHRVGKSAIERIKEVDMVDHFPCDYLHYVCIGANKSTLQMMFTLPCKIRISKEKFELACQIFTELAQYITEEFQWRPNDLKKFEGFKAKEHRYFLLYAGMVVLKDVLEPEVYAAYMRFSCAIRILCTPELVKQEKWLVKAEKLLRGFVHFVKYNVGNGYMKRVIHGLLHLVRDCRRYGVLDNFSAFYFESFQGQLGQLIHGPANELSQIVNRYMEQEQVAFLKNKESRVSSGLQLSMPTTSGSLVVQETVEMFGKCVFKGYNYRTSRPNNALITKMSTIFIIENIIKRGEQVKFVGREYSNFTSYFTIPMKSTLLNIASVKTDAELGPLKEISLDNVWKKVIFFTWKENHIFIPLQH